MKSKLIYLSWLLTFGVVVGCALWPSGATAQKTVSAVNLPTAGPTDMTGFPYRGVAIQIQRTDWIEKYKQSIDDAAAIGADTVSLVIDTRMENGTSSRIWLDMRYTPTPEQLGELITHAKKKGLRVMLMPIVLLDNPQGNEWRGTIDPKSWEDWWDSYRSVMIHFSWIAEGYHADILSVGSELVSTEGKVEQWRRTIADVREVFSGKLIYSANWDHYTSIPFWGYLDMVGMNSYWKLGANRHVPVEEIKKNWREIKDDVLAFKKKVNKPILFTEVGWCSLTNAAHEPWDYTKMSEDVDLQIQKKLYQGFFESWYGNPNLGGFMVWEWPPDQGGPENRGYIPKGKPAEAVLREWMAKPRWQVY